MIERISLAFTKRILRITPQVARRTGWDKHSHNEAFYIKFRTEAGRDEVSTIQNLCRCQLSRIEQFSISVKTIIDIALKQLCIFESKVAGIVSGLTYNVLCNNN